MTEVANMKSPIPVDDWEIDAMFLNEDRSGPSELLGALMHDKAFRDQFVQGLGHKLPPPEEAKKKLELMQLGAEYCNKTGTTPEQLEEQLRELRKEHDKKQAAKRAKKKEELNAREAEEEEEKKEKREQIRALYSNSLPTSLADRKIEELEEMSLFQLTQLARELDEKRRKAEIGARGLQAQRSKGNKTFDELKALLERSLGCRFETDFQAKFWTKLDGRPEGQIMKDLKEELGVKKTEPKKDPRQQRRAPMHQVKWKRR